jgi:hypothetical protein
MFKRTLVPLVLALAFAPGAQAAGGHYVFDGGTRAEQAHPDFSQGAVFSERLQPG